MGALGLASQALAVPYPGSESVPEPRAEAIQETFLDLKPEVKQLETRQNKVSPNEYLKQTPEYILKELIGNIVCAQTQIKELSPSCNHAFDKSIVSIRLPVLSRMVY